jgi:hypothetical protein
LTALSALLRGLEGAEAAGAGVLGAAFGVIVAGFAGIDFAVAVAPAGVVLAGALADDTDLGVEEFGALDVFGLLAGAEAVGLRAMPGGFAVGVVDLATGLFTVVIGVADLGATASAAGGACFGAPFVAL